MYFIFRNQIVKSKFQKVYFFWKICKRSTHLKGHFFHPPFVAPPSLTAPLVFTYTAYVTGQPCLDKCNQFCFSCCCLTLFR